MARWRLRPIAARWAGRNGAHIGNSVEILCYNISPLYLVPLLQSSEVAISPYSFTVMQASFDRAPRSIWKKLVFVWLGILVLMVFYWVHLYQANQDQLQKTQQQAVLRSSQVANALTRQTEVLLRNINFIVSHLSEHWTGKDTSDFYRVISVAQDTLPKGALIQIAIADARGNVVFSNLTPPGHPVPAVSIADRPHFKAYLQADPPQIYISEPVWGRVSDQWVVQFTRPIRTQGALAYVIVASVSVEYLAEAFRQVLPDPQDVVLLLNQNGRYLTRSHSLMQAMGAAVPADRGFLKHRDQQNGVYETSTAVDGVMRYYAWQRIPGYPVILSLGLGKEKVLGPVLAELRNNYIVNAAASLLLLVSALWISYLTLIKATQNQQLEETQERLQQTVEAARVGLWFWNVNSGAMHWDQHCQEITGHGDSGLPSRYGDWCALLHVHDRELVERSLREQIQSASGQSIALECRLRGADDVYRWIELRGRITQPGLAADGKERHFMGTCTDIGARVAASQLRRALLDQSTAAILLVNAQRGIVQASTRAEQLFSPKGSTLVGQHADMLHLDDAHSQAMQTHYQQLRKAGVTRMVHPLKDVTGAIRWFDMQAILYDPDDAESPAVWTMIDVTDGYVAKKNLEIQSSRLTTLLERFPAGVLLEDADCRIVMANSSFCSLLGLGQEPQALKNLRHAALLEQLSPEQAAWLPLPGNRLEKRRTTQINDGPERFLEIDWVPIVREEVSLGHVWLLRDVTERKQKEKQLAILASTDTLTNLPNRRSFMAMLARRLESQGGATPHGALLMLDIDHFKKVNDTYGHPVGDLVLQQMAQVMRQSLRADDYAARLGGEEFVVLLHQTTLEESRLLAERLRECVASQPTDAGEAGMIAITVSIGLVELAGQESQMALEHADKALYAAKAGGRNRVCIATPD